MHLKTHVTMPAIRSITNTSSIHKPLPTSTKPWSLDSILISLIGLLFGLDMREPSPVTANFAFVRSPTYVILAILSYLFIVSKWQSRIKNLGVTPTVPEPIWLHRIIVMHNAILYSLNIYLGIGILFEALRRGYSVWGNQYNDDDLQMGSYIYIFYVSKFYEFMDTFLMLMKGDARQIQSLHLYHHSSIAFVCWIICYLSPTGDIYFVAAVNAWLHAAMYFYFLLATTIARTDNQKLKYLWWGKYLAGLQLLQFILFVMQSMYGLLRPKGYAPNLPRFLFIYSMSLLLLFARFFFLKYLAPLPAWRRPLNLITKSHEFSERFLGSTKRWSTTSTSALPTT